MRQFLDVKERYPDAVVFFRMGDFYEMFFDDAVVASQALGLTLTSRDKGKVDSVPMCGVPHHAGRAYIAKLTDLGHKIVLCEQVEDPKHAKGLVRREVVRVVTPGIVLDDESLTPNTAHYDAAIVVRGASSGQAYLDVTTGEFRATSVTSVAALADELARVRPREVVAAIFGAADDAPISAVRRRWPVSWTHAADVSDEVVDDRLSKLAGIDDLDRAARAAVASVLTYAQATQPVGRLPVQSVIGYRPDDAVLLDDTAIANLELIETLMGRQRQGSLLDLLDVSVTAAGGRTLRRWLLYPLTDVAAISSRQDGVEWLVDTGEARAALRKSLAEVFDLERLAGKIALQVVTPRDLARLRDSLAAVPVIAKSLAAAGSKKKPVPAVLSLADVALAELAKVTARLADALVDDPPVLVKEGGYIRTGFDATVDECRRLANGGKDEILAIEEQERTASGNAGLKIRYNRVFGYYIEITKSQLARVPKHFVRKQTVATGERFVTPALAELERKVLSAEQTLLEREAEILRAVVADISLVCARIAHAGQRLAMLDASAALAEVAVRRGFVRPVVDDSFAIDIVDGRHPVVESLLPPGAFVPNDCHLDAGGAQVVLITGPNMAGKSTYMRQVAQIVLLAQMGSFVPAKSARIGLCDRLFTRVGAADNLARGDSTFMVEMKETAAILAGGTRRSLVILDEVGRGTSTYDGVSIAWAITEHLHDVTGARTLFATHYHELTALADSRARIANRSVAVREQHGEIVFLRRVVEGGASKSYGIDVARLAGLPKQVISRARQILGKLEGSAQLGASPQLSLSSLLDTPIAVRAEAAPPAWMAKLRELDINQLTPMAALSMLSELHQAARGGEN